MSIAASFLESFDSVRHDSRLPVADRRPRQIQAESELMLSLLLGQPMLVPESYSFDSEFFLRFAASGIESRKAFKPPTGTPPHAVWNPFILVTQGSGMDARYSACATERLMRSGFRFSAWPDLDEGKRVALARALGELEAPKRRRAVHGLGRRGDFTAVEIDNLEHVLLLDDYFSRVQPRYRRPPKASLGERVKQTMECPLTAVSEERQDGLRRLQAALRRATSYLDAQNQKSAQEAPKLSVNLRSDLYECIDRAVCRADDRQIAKEFVDSCYGRVLADSAACSTALLSARENPGDPDVQVGEDLAEDLSRQDGESGSIGAPSADGSTRLHLRITDFDVISRRRDAPLRFQGWPALWELVSQPEWSQKAAAFHRTMREHGSPHDPVAVEALQSYLSFVSEGLGNSWVFQVRERVGAIWANVVPIVEYAAGEMISNLVQVILGWELWPEFDQLLEPAWPHVWEKVGDGLQRRTATKVRGYINGRLAQSVGLAPGA